MRLLFAIVLLGAMTAGCFEAKKVNNSGNYAKLEPVFNVLQDFYKANRKLPQGYGDIRGEVVKQYGSLFNIEKTDNFRWTLDTTSPPKPGKQRIRIVEITEVQEGPAQVFELDIR